MMPRTFLLCFVLLGLIGCSTEPEGPQRFELKGKVTYNDKPVPYGELIFSPDTSAGNTGPGATAEIIEGNYLVPSERGVVGGPHIVTITGFTAAPSKSAIPEPGTPPSTPLFAPRELKQTLPTSAGTQDFVVPAQ